MFKFKSEDFDKAMAKWDPEITALTSFGAALCANKILDEWRKSWVRVYLDKEDNGWHDGEQINKGKTFQGYLVEIEELPKKECEEHIPLSYFDVGQASSPVKYSCEKCGKKLKQKWELAE